MIFVQWVFINTGVFQTATYKNNMTAIKTCKTRLRCFHGHTMERLNATHLENHLTPGTEQMMKLVQFTAGLPVHSCQIHVRFYKLQALPDWALAAFLKNKLCKQTAACRPFIQNPVAGKTWTESSSYGSLFFQVLFI